MSTGIFLTGAGTIADASRAGPLSHAAFWLRHLFRGESRKLLPLPVFKLLDLCAANQGQAGQRQKTEHEQHPSTPV